MTCKETKSLVDDYVRWLSEQFTVEEVAGVCEIVTPFVDRHNDAIVIYVQKNGNELMLSDDGYTLNDLSLSGVGMTEKREEIIGPILKGFGVVRRGDELVVRTRPEDFPRRKHELIQAILSVNDMFMIGQEYVRGLFFEEVKAFLRSKRVQFDEFVEIVGNSGMEHRIDFVLTSIEQRVEHLIQAVSAPDKQSIITKVLYPLADIGEYEGREVRMYAILNDKVKVPSELITHVKNGGAFPILWNQREEAVGLFGVT